MLPASPWRGEVSSPFPPGILTQNVLMSFPDNNARALRITGRMTEKLAGHGGATDRWMAEEGVLWYGIARLGGAHSLKKNVRTPL